MQTFKSFLSESRERQFLMERAIVLGNNAKYGNVIFLAGGAGCHKAGTNILMSDGSYKEVQDIELGDSIMRPDSGSATVIDLHNGREEMLLVKTTKGEEYTVNRSHIHTFIASFSKCGFEKGVMYDMTYDEYMMLKPSAQKALKLKKSDCIDFGGVWDNDIDPWIIGMWIGDGVCSNTNIIIGDKYSEIICDEVTSIVGDGYSFNKIKSDHKGCGCYSLTSKNKHNPYRTYLTNNCYIDNEKRLPKSLLLSTIDARMKLLSGIIDSDGHNGGGYYEIVTKFEGLKDDIYFLASSLGFYVNVTSKYTTWNGEKKKYYRITISGNVSSIPVVLPHKKCSERKQKKNVLHHGFSVEIMPEDSYYGFTLDSDDQRYMMDNFIVTHNSGKGFATDNFLQASNYKVRDVDEHKRLFLKINRELKKHKEIGELNLRNPDDVSKLHEFVSKKKIKNKTLTGLLRDVRNDRLPNILFDITAKSPSDVTKNIPMLINTGYKIENIHLVWVLTQFETAVKNNAGRDRVVGSDILLATHEGARDTMTKFLLQGKAPRDVNGDIYVILNNKENTIFYTGKVNPDGTPEETRDFGKAFKRLSKTKVYTKEFNVSDMDKSQINKTLNDFRDNLSEAGKIYVSHSIVGDNLKVKYRDYIVAVKDFKSLHIKKRGKKPLKNKQIMDQLAAWVNNNAPKKSLDTK